MFDKPKSLRSKAFLYQFLFIAFVVASFVFVPILFGPNYMTVVLLVDFFAGIIVSTIVKCPICKTPLSEISPWLYSPIPAKKCYKCGHNHQARE